MADENVSLAQLAEYEEELVGFNPDADANAMLPPLPKGPYVCVAYHTENDPTKLWRKKVSKANTTYYITDVTLEVIENPANTVKESIGRKLRYPAMSLVMQQTGTTLIQALLQAMEQGERLKTGPRTAGRQALVLTEELNKRPLVVAYLDWEARLFDKDYQNPDGTTGKELYRRRGMNRFPKDEKGNFIPVIVFKDSDGTERDVTAYSYVHHLGTVRDLMKKSGSQIDAEMDEAAMDGEGVEPEGQEQPEQALQGEPVTQTAPVAGVQPVSTAQAAPQPAVAPSTTQATPAAPPAPPAPAPAQAPQSAQGVNRPRPVLRRPGMTAPPVAAK